MVLKDYFLIIIIQMIQIIQIQKEIKVKDKKVQIEVNNLKKDI